MNTGSFDTYSRKSQIFHWTGAFLVIGLWTSGTVMEDAGSESLGNLLLRLHVGVGMLLAIHTVSRLLTLLRKGRPSALPMEAWREKAFEWNHRLIYLVLFLLFATGLATLLSNGVGLSPFGLQASDIEEVISLEIHEILSNAILALFIMHVAGVIHYQLKEGDTLSRMGLRIGQRS